MGILENIEKNYKIVQTAYYEIRKIKIKYDYRDDNNIIYCYVV